jgi:hypothetical protein
MQICILKGSVTVHKNEVKCFICVTNKFKNFLLVYGSKSYYLDQSNEEYVKYAVLFLSCIQNKFVSNIIYKPEMAWFDPYLLQEYV